MSPDQLSGHLAAGASAFRRGPTETGAKVLHLYHECSISDEREHEGGVPAPAASHHELAEKQAGICVSSKAEDKNAAARRGILPLSLFLFPI